MKKITILALLLFMGISINAQVSYEGVSDFGKLQNLTYHPTIQNRIYAASQGNHIMVSNDNGTSWTLLYSFPDPQTRINNLKFIDESHITFNVSGSVSVQGIYTFSTVTNAVTTFIQSPYTDNGAQIVSYDLFNSTALDIIVHISYSENFAAKSKVFHTIDGGTNWNLIYFSDDNNTIQVNNVAISPINKAKLFIARSLGAQGTNGGLLISNDFGVTWTEKMAGFPFGPITFNPANGNDILVGTGISFNEVAEGLYRSGNGGTTWTQVPITFTDLTLNNITSITFSVADPTKIIVLDENEIIKSNDGGTTWASVAYPDYSPTYYYGLDASFNPFNVNQIAISTDFYPQMSIDGGTTLTQITVPYYNVTSVAHAKNNSEKHLYYGAQGGRIHKNISTGNVSIFEAEPPTRFNPKNHYLSPDKTVPGRVFNLANRGFFGGHFSVSNDYGLTYTDLFESYSTDSQEILVDPTNTNIVYAALRNGDNGGVTKINFNDLENIITEDLNMPEAYEDGGGVVTGFSITATNSSEMYVAKGHKFFKSIDAGTTWVEKINGLALNPATDLIWDMQRNPLNPNQFTIACNLGVFTSLDLGETWTQILNNVDARRITYSPDNNGVMIISAFSAAQSEAAIHYTTNFGLTWSTVTSAQLNYVQCYSMDFDFDGNTINAYLATTDLGVMKYAITDLNLGINNPNSPSNAISIYPNPVSDFVNIIVKGNSYQIESISIFSLTGQKILESKLQNIDISNLSKGIYLVTVSTSNNEQFTQKLVKK